MRKTDWETPQGLFDALDNIFHFTIDVCASPENAKCQRFFTESNYALSKTWEGVCWMNPPYGRKIGTWVKKAWESGKSGATVVALLPASTDTKWWHAYCEASEHLFLKGRLRFGNANMNAPFPSALVVFRPTLRDLLFGGE